MQQNSEQKERVGTKNEIIEVWKITTTLRRSKPYTHSKIERWCIFKCDDGICEKIFDRKYNADRHVKSHYNYFKGTIYFNYITIYTYF